MTWPTMLAVVKPGPLVVAAVVVAVLVWRWRRLSTENRLLAALAAAGLVVYGSGVIQLPELQVVVRRVGEVLGPYTYVLVGAMAFLETGAFIGLVAPGEVTVILGGVIAGQGEIEIVPLIGLVWACAVAGDVTSYVIGRRLGRDFLVRHGARVKITDARLSQVEGFFERYGGATIIVGRFVGLIRALAPFIAGASRMPFARFIPYDLVAAGIWATFFSVLGYVFWQSFDQVIKFAKRGAFALGATIAVVVGAIALYRYLRMPENRIRAEAWLDEQGRRPALRPLASAIRPLYRHVLRPAGAASVGPLGFLRDRLTPGRLGLELTTLAAVALVGAYAYFALAIEIGPGSTFFADGRAFAIAGGLRLDITVEAMRELTRLGSARVVGALVVVAGAYLLMRRETLEALVIVVGSLLTYFAVNLAKAAEARPRPADGLVEVASFSFPSGHAAYSVVYVAVAVAVVHVLGNFIYRAAVVVGCVALAGAVGLTRVYLRVHYLSDVLAGWGLAAAIFATCGLIALVVAFLRHNARQRRRGAGARNAPEPSP